MRRADEAGRGAGIRPATTDGSTRTPAQVPAAARPSPAPPASPPASSYAGEVAAPRARTAPSPSSYIDRRIAPELQPISGALSSHWRFLYERARPDAPSDTPGLTFTRRRTEAAGIGVQKGLELLEQRGHRHGTGVALVMGGGYEVDLAPLLGRFAEVHVVDMSDEPLKLAAAKYADHPFFEKLRLIQADLSGISEVVQKQELDRAHRTQRTGEDSVDPEQTKGFFEAVPENLVELPFRSGEYAMVVSPVLNESLPFGTVVEGLESERVAKTKRTGEDAPRRAVDDAMGEGFFYRPEVRAATDAVFQHHHDELQRMLAPGGVAVFSSWMRPDEHQATLAPDAGEPLVRVGDSRMTRERWDATLEGWGRTHALVEQQPLYAPEMPNMKARMNVFVLEKPQA